ncbi:uncharacterized protein zgc:65997 isoform X1 [Antennarius striatus]|uniref:uncharacterized protein zgc:65997 isoform X1 n=1 Tax=Antennarius striatus TaxID=241820 RepID=UPI0035B4A190
MAVPVALIQGASRGLGLAFCKHILKSRTSAAVIATCRSPDGAADLRVLAGQHAGRLTVLKLDVDREEDVREAAARVKESFGRLDLIVNSSAMLHPSGKGETSLRDVSAQGIISTLKTNTVGPLVMAKYFSPILQKGGGGFGQQPAEKSKQHSGVIVNITAKVGSIGDNGWYRVAGAPEIFLFKSVPLSCKRNDAFRGIGNTCLHFPSSTFQTCLLSGLGGWYSYRMSKAALNMATRNLSIELGRSRPKVVCVSLHPGTVNTDLSRQYHKNVPKDKLFDAEQSVSYLMSIIDTLNIEKTGKAYSWDGTELPW